MEIEQAVFGGGCFWCTEALFRELRGVERVVSGYAGGEDDRPTYERVSGGNTGHAEVISIHFDPSQITYHDLLTVFFATHDPTTLNRQGADVGTQSLQTQLSANSLCDFFSRSIVTKFLANQDNVTSVLINGQKTLMAKNFIYAGNVRDLRLLLPEGALNQRALAKLGKNQYWTSVGLDILFENKITDSEAVHVLNGTTSDDIGPCAGIFYPVEASDNAPQFSQWISFLDDLEAEEEENIGAVLKKIKRQIKRAYPEGSDKIIFERIMIVRNFGGDGELKLKEDGTIGNLKNLWIASPSVNPEKNILGALLQAQFIVNSATGDLLRKPTAESSTTTENSLQTAPSLDQQLDL
jgi:methionine-S-sulfoxide reductase